MGKQTLLGVLALPLMQTPAVAALAADGCTAKSGAGTAALVELYTSEGCSSCPPAERWLSGLPRAGLSLTQAVPLAFHVPYWDDLGWSDAYASPDFARRQSWLVALNSRRTVYTPHFFVAGGEVLDWRSHLVGAIAKVGAGETAASIKIGATRTSGNRLTVTAQASAAAPQARLFIAVTESGLVSAVRAGENSGVTLHHAHVVRRLLGPLPLTPDTQHVPLGKDWNPSRLGIVAFVQDMRDGRVLQAVATERCVLGE